MKNAKTTEYKVFLMKNIKWLLIFGFLFGAIGGVYRFLSIQGEETSSFQEIDELPQESTTTSDIRTSFFQFYIEREDGMVFYNYATVERFLNSEVTYEKVLNDTSIDLVKIREELTEKNEKKGKDDVVRPIRVRAEENSNILTTIIETGNTRTNLRLANYLYNYLFGPDFDLFENNNVYLITSPQLIKMSNEEDNNENQIQPPSNEADMKLDSSVFIVIIIGLIGGVFLTLIVLVIKELKSKKLKYSFSYIFDDSDDFIFYDNTLVNEENISKFIGIPYVDKKIILSEKILTDAFKALLLKNIRNEISLFGNDSEKMYLEFHQSLIDVPLKDHFNEIIIIVTSGETTRSWFESEMKLSEIYGVPVKIIHVNTLE